MPETPLPKLPPLLLFHGKGGVGRTTLSKAFALKLARQKPGEKILWVGIEDPTEPWGEMYQPLRLEQPNLWYLNAEASRCFEEYVGMKLGIPKLASFFLGNRLVQYLSQAAPGLHELVLLGKIWFERNLNTHVVVDLPSTGYGLALFQSTKNFARIFASGPLSKDAHAMLETFGNKKETQHWIVSLPEEMPIREALETREKLLEWFPENEADLIVNRVWPKFDLAVSATGGQALNAKDRKDYLLSRARFEALNLEILKSKNLLFIEIPAIPDSKDSKDPKALGEFLTPLFRDRETP